MHESLYLLSGCSVNSSSLYSISPSYLRPRPPQPSQISLRLAHIPPICSFSASTEGNLISSRSGLAEELLNGLHQHEQPVGMIRKVHKSVALVEISCLLIFGIDDNRQRGDVLAVE